jgi:hypothetical protein
MQVIGPIASRSALPGCRSPAALPGSPAGAGRPNRRCPNSAARWRSARAACGRENRQPAAIIVAPCHSSQDPDAIVLRVVALLLMAV